MNDSNEIVICPDREDEIVFKVRRIDGRNAVRGNAPLVDDVWQSADLLEALSKRDELASKETGEGVLYQLMVDAEYRWGDRGELSVTPQTELACGLCYGAGEVLVSRIGDPTFNPGGPITTCPSCHGRGSMPFQEPAEGEDSEKAPPKKMPLSVEEFGLLWDRRRLSISVGFADVSVGSQILIQESYVIQKPLDLKVTGREIVGWIGDIDKTSPGIEKGWRILTLVGMMNVQIDPN